jgi:hypothetical protein
VISSVSLFPLFGAPPDGEVLVIFVLFAAIAWVIPIAGSVWVYRDAETRRETDPIPWTLATLLSGGLAVILYIAIRSEKSPADSNDSPNESKRNAS